MIIDEFTRENLCLEAGYGFKSEDAIDCLVAISAERELLKFIRSDNGPEFIADRLGSGWVSLTLARYTSN